MFKVNLALIVAAFALSACVTNAGTNPYHAAGAGQYIIASPASASSDSGNIHAISEGELHW